MKLEDISNGPSWIIWITFIFLAVLSGILLSGNGANLIAGYNTLSGEGKAKYNEQKLRRVVGFGMLIVTILILVMGLGELVLPAWFAYASLGIIIVDYIVMIILSNTICKNKTIYFSYDNISARIYFKGCEYGPRNCNIRLKRRRQIDACPCDCKANRLF